MSEPIATGRLHPSSVFFRLVPHVRALLIPGLVVLIASKGGGWQVWLMLMIVPSTIYELGQYFTLRYELSPEELVVRSGLFWKRDRRIPVERIHGVDLTQGPLHRLARVADVRVETAGGNEPEAVLRVLGLAHVEQLRASLSRARAATGDPLPGITDTSEPPETPERELLHLPPDEITKLGLVSLRGAAAVGVLVALAWEFDLFERLRPEFFKTAIDHLEGWPLLIVGGMVVVGLPALLVIASIAWSLLRLHDFRLVERGEDLRLSCGLLTKHHATIPRRRIQLVSVISSPVHRLFDRVSVRVETAGGSTEQEDKKVIGQKWFIPLIPTERLPGILTDITGRIDVNALEWRGLSDRAFARRAKKAVLLALALAGVVGAAFWPWGLLSVFAFVPLLLWHARADLRRTAYAPFEGGIAFRSGVLSRRTTFTFDDRIQAVALDESPFDRRRRMATVDVDTAGAGAAGHRIRIPYLDRETAAALFARLAGSAGRARPNL